MWKLRLSRVKPLALGRAGRDRSRSRTGQPGRGPDHEPRWATLMAVFGVGVRQAEKNARETVGGIWL